jgi:hypothetical protein
VLPLDDNALFLLGNVALQRLAIGLKESFGEEFLLEKATRKNGD